MTRDDAVLLLNEVARDLAEYRAPGWTPEQRIQLRADIRAELWEAEKVFYDRGFAEAAALHAETTSSTQPQ